MKKICVVTGSRAEYGLLRPLLGLITEDAGFQLQLIVTGMHLSPEFGLTYRVIEKEGFVIDEKIEMLLSSDTDSGITKSIGLGIIGFADAIRHLQPDWLLVLGDRYEIFAAATAAYFAKVPIIHLYGGETTVGSTDEALRHSITKMSHLHFTSTEIYRKRVVQLGEEPNSVFNVGAIGIDNIFQLPLLSKINLEKELLFSDIDKAILVTFHPVTIENNTAKEQTEALLQALSEFPDTKVIFTLPNADASSRIIIQLVKEYVDINGSRCSWFASLGQLRYLSTLQYVRAIVGNSSSGIIEAPSFKIPTVNIGDRQKGRIRCASIIDSLPEKQSIVDALTVAFSDDFISTCRNVKSPYGRGTAARSILSVIKEINNNTLLKKRFYDIS